MKKAILSFIFSFFVLFCVGQGALTRYYDYDFSGNRVLRSTIPVGAPPAKSGKADTREDTLQEPYYVDMVGDISVHIFPNPTSQMLTLKIENYPDFNSGKLMLYNMNGQLLQQITITSPETRIDLSGYPTGVYLAKLYINDYKNEWKIVKQ